MASDVTHLQVSRSRLPSMSAQSHWIVPQSVLSHRTGASSPFGSRMWRPLQWFWSVGCRPSFLRVYTVTTWQHRIRTKIRNCCMLSDKLKMCPNSAKMQIMGRRTRIEGTVCEATIEAHASCFSQSQSYDSPIKKPSGIRVTLWTPKYHHIANSTSCVCGGQWQSLSSSSLKWQNFSPFMRTICYWGQQHHSTDVR